MSDTAGSGLDSWQFNLAAAAVTGVVSTVVRPADHPRLVRSTHVLLGLAGAAAGALTDQTPEEDQIPGAVDSRTLASRLGWGVGAGLLTAATSVGSVWFDGAVERALVRRGVRRPRVWIGVAAAGLSLAMWAAERAFEDDQPVDQDEASASELS